MRAEIKEKNAVKNAGKDIGSTERITPAIPIESEQKQKIVIKRLTPEQMEKRITPKEGRVVDSPRSREAWLARGFDRGPKPANEEPTVITPPRPTPKPRDGSSKPTNNHNGSGGHGGI